MNKIAVITGVSREEGLGFETAKQLLKKGYEVVLTARDSKAVQSLAEKAGNGAHAMVADVTSDVSVAALAENLKTKFNKIDALINNAGGFYDQGNSVFTTDMDFAKMAFDTNLLGAWRMCKAFLPLLQQSKSGHIVNVSSGAGSYTDTTFGLPYNQGNVPVYGVTKLALNGLTVKLANELNDTPIIVNAVCPGFVATYPGTEGWGARPVREGAMGIVWAATLPDDGPRGGFFRDGKPIVW